MKPLNVRPAFFTSLTALLHTHTHTTIHTANTQRSRLKGLPPLEKSQKNDPQAKLYASQLRHKNINILPVTNCKFADRGIKTYRELIISIILLLLQQQSTPVCVFGAGTRTNSDDYICGWSRVFDAFTRDFDHSTSWEKQDHLSHHTSCWVQTSHRKPLTWLRPSFLCCTSAWKTQNERFEAIISLTLFFLISSGQQAVAPPCFHLWNVPCRAPLPRPPPLQLQSCPQVSAARQTAASRPHWTFATSIRYHPKMTPQMQCTMGGEGVSGVL